MPVRVCVEVSDTDSSIYQPPPAPLTPPIVAGNYRCDPGANLSYTTARAGERVARGSRPLLGRYCCKRVENRTTLKLSPKSIFGLLCCCVALQRHYGGI